MATVSSLVFEAQSPILFVHIPEEQKKPEVDQQYIIEEIGTIDWLLDVVPSCVTALRGPGYIFLQKAFA